MNIFLSIVLLPMSAIGYLFGWVYEATKLGYKSGVQDCNHKIEKFANGEYSD